MLIEKYVTPKMWNCLKERLPEKSEGLLKLQTEEFLKFICIMSERGGSFIPLNKELDDIWHEFILQTHSYEKFCQSLPGKRFIHHESMSLQSYSDIKGRDVVAEQMLSWIPDYIEHYGPFSDKVADFWTPCIFLKNEFGMNVEEINDMGMQKLSERKALST